VDPTCQSACDTLIRVSNCQLRTEWQSVESINRLNIALKPRALRYGGKIGHEAASESIDDVIGVLGDTFHFEVLKLNAQLQLGVSSVAYI
jgi:hypothetical protein